MNRSPLDRNWHRYVFEQNFENAPIEVVTYDPGWPSKFEEERAVLEGLLAHGIVADIEHVGSTAGPGLAAKPIIDIMVPVESLEAARGSIEAASHAGYIYWPYKADVMHWFCKPSAAMTAEHIQKARLTLLRLWTGNHHGRTRSVVASVSMGMQPASDSISD